MNNFLSINNVTYHYPQAALSSLHNISLALPSTALVSALGPNGSGKSTLIKLCSALIKPSSGSVVLDGQPLATSSPTWRAQMIALLAPHWELKPNISVIELLTLFTPHTKTTLHQSPYITLLSLEELLKRNFATLSSGEQSRVLLARTLMLPAQLILLDEPFANIDLEHEDALWHLLQQEATKRLILITSHQLTLAAHYSQHLIILSKGQLHSSGNPSQVFSAQTLNSAWQTHRYRLTTFDDKPAHLWLAKD